MGLKPLDCIIVGHNEIDLQADMANLEKSVSALKARFDVYYGKLKEADGDVSGLQL